MFDLVNTRPEHLWYFVGLIASDGCLIKDGRHIVLTAKDPFFLDQIRQSLALTCGVSRQIGGAGRMYCRLQIYSKNLYAFLLNVGLTPAKSLTLGALRIPAPHFRDFLRGVIDGDGCIRTWIHPSNGLRQWAVKITSASPVFASWLKSSIEGHFQARGRLHVAKRTGKNPIYDIKLGKLAAQVVLMACYYPGCLAMNRKFESAQQCINTPNGVRKYGNVVAGVAKPAHARGLNPRGRKRP